MKFYLTYDEATTLAAVLEVVDSEAVDSIYRRLQASIKEAWNSGKILTPMYTPFIIAVDGEVRTRVVVRKELSGSYSPEVVTLEDVTNIHNAPAEVLVLPAKSFKWRHI
ncbi:hypothetical protein PR1_36 [Providencia phage vB_PreS_PR1]|uniref:Uncharacterized protein n=1 Tax=Providencia phage vB_PreS_PR1 TaxID=1931407 RepID=A0A1S6KV48_9CAUD|nr:hypothetical protein FDH30_gp037 [Providencia phage vB_PreS_PR1]AQT25310.1 hypothetical protein PR1_36 [Providencia phage vB_PreS_PR1]